jgi:hypothetical protein
MYKHKKALSDELILQREARMLQNLGIEPTMVTFLMNERYKQESRLKWNEDY